MDYANIRIIVRGKIKPFATARRALLFADTPKGAKANALLYTLVESARINGLDVFAYLKHRCHRHSV